MTILHVAFVGLISFFQDSTGVNALLLSTSVPRYASDGVLIPRHDAFLALKKALLEDPNSPCPDEADLNRHGQQLFCSWMLSRHDIRFEGNIQSDQGGGPVCVPDQVCLPNACNRCPAPMRGLRPEHFVLKGVCRNPKPQGCPIMGRVFLPVPRIQGVELCGVDLQFKPLRGTAPASNDHPRIAEVTWADLKLTGNSLKLRLRKFGSSTGGRTINLKIVGNDPFIVVANIHRKDKDHSSAGDSTPPEVDRHFELFYSLVEQNPPSGQRLVPHATCESNTPRVSWLLCMLHEIRAYPESKRGLHERIICPMSSF
jgi:hypothetical protein